MEKVRRETPSERKRHEIARGSGCSVGSGIEPMAPLLRADGICIIMTANESECDRDHL